MKHNRNVIRIVPRKDGSLSTMTTEGRRESPAGRCHTTAGRDTIKKYKQTKQNLKRKEEKYLTISGSLAHHSSWAGGNFTCRIHSITPRGAGCLGASHRCFPAGSPVPPAPHFLSLVIFKQQSSPCCEMSSRNGDRSICQREQFSW